MPTAKSKLIELIDAMPDDANADAILAELYFRMQVEAGIADVEAGRVLTHEEVEARVNSWSN